MAAAILRRPALRFALALLAAGAPLFAQEPQQPLTVETPAPLEAAPEPAKDAGPVVTAIEVRSDSPLDPALDLETLIEIEVGEPMTEEAVRHTLRNLQASGTASETEIYTREDPAAPRENGVVAVVVFRAVVQVKEVRVEGELGLSRDGLRRAIPQKEAQPLSEERVVQGVYALQDLYERSGYFHARVRVAVEADPSRRGAVVIYRVNSGPRATVGTLSFDHPVDPFPAAELVRQLRQQSGKPFSRRVANEDAERLQDWLFGRQYGLARVDEPREKYEAEGNAVDLTFPITVGPKVSVVVKGADEKELRRKGLLPFLGGSGYDEALVLQAQSRISTYFQQQGHYDVKVETGEQQANGQLVLTLQITPGPIYTLDQVVLKGNQEVPDDELRKVMTTAGRDRLLHRNSRLVQSVLDADLDNLRRYYALAGYSQAVVGPARVDRREQDLAVTIPIQEGPRERVVRIDFEGVASLDSGALRKRLPLEEGKGFHPVLLEAALDAIRSEYGNQGYSQAQVSVRQDWNPEHTLVDLVFEVLEGPRQVVDRILVRGNQRTQGDVIRRTLDLDPGKPVSQTRLLETERNLYQLGIFSSVDVAFVPAGLDETARDVIVRVEEGKPRSVLYGVGWDSENGFRGLFGFSDNNVWGKAYSLRTDLRWSQRDKRFRVLFNQPYLGDHPVSLTSTVFYEQEAPTDRPYEVTRYGARAEAFRVYGNRRITAGLDYRIVEPSVDPGIATNETERRNQPYQVTSFIPSFFWDRRDDPILTTRGWSTLAQIQYAFPVPVFRTDTEFLKLFVQQTNFVNLGRPGVLAASVRLGSIEPYKSIPSTGVALDFPSRNIPIAERFFAGGDASHRAYGRDELGIRGESLILNPNGKGYVPVGGNGLLLINLEYRFPIYDGFGGTLFFDSGNVWGDWRSINLKELKNGVGLGGRYNSPIGPVRAGIGWKLDREKGESAYALFFNIGNAF